MGVDSSRQTGFSTWSLGAFKKVLIRIYMMLIKFQLLSNRFFWLFTRLQYKKRCETTDLRTFAIFWGGFQAI